MALGTIGKYERLDVLGHGASGIVYLARDTLLRRQVAIKEISAQGEERDRFLEEARVLDRLRHPNIVAVNSVDTLSGKIVIDMEYVDGENLLEILRRAQGPLPVAQAVEIAAQACEGLAYAQERHIVHRDIKPANILVSRRGEVKLADFGLAQVLGTNSFVGGAGTYAYMAPEDFGEGEASDAQADIWALGVILYEMLTGRRPFTVARPKDPFAWKRAIETEPIDAPAGVRPGAVPPELSRIALTALARDRDQRYRSAAQMAAALRRVQQATPLGGAASAWSDAPASSTASAPHSAGNGTGYSNGSSNGSVSGVEGSLTRPASLPTVGPYDAATVLASAGERAAGAGPGPGPASVPTLLIGASDVDTFLSYAPGQWATARGALVDGLLARWLERIGEAPLAGIAGEAQRESRHEHSDYDALLRDFLYRAGLDTAAVAHRSASAGSSFLRAGAYEDATEALLQAIRLDPSHAAYFLQLYKALMASGDTASAAVAVARGLEFHPRDRALRRENAKVMVAQPQVSVSEIDFGTLRRGEQSRSRFTVRNASGVSGTLQGRISELPPWLEATPMSFVTRRQQPITLVASTAHLWEQGQRYEGRVGIETSSGMLEIGVRVAVRPPLRSFQQVFAWYVPLLLAALAPLLAGELATLRHPHAGAPVPYYAAGLLASGLLFASLWQISTRADAGPREKLWTLAGALLGPLGAWLTWLGRDSQSLVSAAIASALPAAALLVAEGVFMLRAPRSLGRWPVWGWAMALAAALATAALWHRSDVMISY